jgi:uncharacterized membrane protein YkoI
LLGKLVGLSQEIPSLGQYNPGIYKNKETFMNQKLTLTLAAALTAFVLVVGGAVAGRLTQPAAAATPPSVTEVQNLYAQREAEYQARLDEANQALNEAYALLDSASTNTASVVEQSQPQIPTFPEVALTPQEAMSAAVIAVPGARILSIPELVDFQGTVAYEVILDLGTVYIDASNGAVLYDGTVYAQSAAPTYNQHDDEHDDD